MGIGVTVNVKQTWKGRRLLRSNASATETALDDLGRWITFEAKRRAPYRTGNLSRSIDWEPPERERPGIWRIFIFATATYAAFVELGTVFMRARPYIAPAARQGRHILGEILRKEFRRRRLG